MKYQAKKKQKLGRNSPCPCGSGLKYKKCCLKKASPFLSNARKSNPLTVEEIYLKKFNIRIKTESDIRKIRKAGSLVIDTLDLAESFIKPGITTNDINTLVHDFTLKNNAIPAPLNYRGYPKSTCVSVNEVICHGIPSNRVLEDGDIVNVDVTSILDGYYADANKTYFVGTPNKGAKKVVDVSRQCLKIGMEKVFPGNTLGDVGWAIQNYAESNGCSVVREFVGHGVGFSFHEAPQVPHYGRKGEGVVLVPGMIFTVEPMINMGKKDIRILKDKWTAVTKDNSLSAQFEQTVLVTPNGCESLTPYDL